MESKIIDTNTLCVKIRRKLNDMEKVKWDDNELMYAINLAIEELCIKHFEAKDPEYVEKIILQPGADVKRPDDFYSFQGQYPVEFYRKGPYFFIQPLDYNYENQIVCRYYAMRPKVVSMDDEVPFYSEHEQEELVMSTVQQLMGPGQQEGGESNDGN